MPASTMPANFQCDVYQEFNFKKDLMVTVGYMNSLTIAGIQLTADLVNLTDPVALENSMNVVGAMDYLLWSGMPRDPIQMSLLVDDANQVSLQNLISSGVSNASIGAQFTIYDYDPAARKYYASFWTNGTLNGVLSSLNIAPSSKQPTGAPPLYSCDLQMGPISGSQQLIYRANSASAKFLSFFG